jgi:hypothetical protein
MSADTAATTRRGSRHVREKKIVRELLEKRDREGLVQWADGRKKGINALLSLLLYETD